MKTLNESLPSIDMAVAAISKRRVARPPMQDNNNHKGNTRVMVLQPMPNRSKAMATSQSNFNACWSQRQYEEDIKDNGLGSKTNDSTILGSSSSCPSMNEGVEGALAPYEWLDDEIMKLSNMFENGGIITNELEDPNRNNNCGLLMGGEERKNGVWISESGEWNNTTSCSSSVNSVYDYQWSDINLACGIHFPLL